MDQPPQTLLELIAWIRKKPGLFIEYKSVVQLSAFLRGWTLGHNSIDEGSLLIDFTAFCRKRFDIHASQGWWRIIEFHSVSPDEGWALFEKLWDQYTEKLGARKSS